MNKYNAKRTTCNYLHKHASKKEAERCDELGLLVKAGIITELKQQVRITLLENFRFQNESIRGIVYVADFTYYDRELKKFVIEDSKGYKTDVYKLKRRLLLSIMKARTDFRFLET